VPDQDADSVAGKDPLRFNNWMKRSATGAVITGIALGLQKALEAEKPAVPFVIEASEPDDPDGLIDLEVRPGQPFRHSGHHPPFGRRRRLGYPFGSMPVEPGPRRTATFHAEPSTINTTPTP